MVYKSVLCYIATSLYTDSLDYTANSEVITFSQSRTSAILQVAILDDDVVENTETFAARAELTMAARGVTVIPAESTVTILDNDSKLQNLSVS